MKNNTKKFRKALQKALQRGEDGGTKDPLPLGYLLKRAHLFSIACYHMTLISSVLRANESAAAFLAIKKVKDDCDIEMEKFNETIDYENPENNEIG